MVRGTGKAIDGPFSGTHSRAPVGGNELTDGIDRR